MDNNSNERRNLENIGLKYLSKFEASENQFRIFLRNKIDQFEIATEIDVIEKIVCKMKKLNYINDMRYSRLKCEQNLRNGSSKRFIIFKLKQKGICGPIIDHCLKTLFKCEINEFAAALIYIRKKKIGVYYIGNDELDIITKNKWIGKLSRRGFPYHIVKKVFEINNIQDAEDIINGMEI